MAADPGLAERREPLDLRPGIIVLVGLGTLGFVMASLVVLGLFYAAMRTGGSFASMQAFPGPRLQSDPAGELRAYQAAQRARLEGYAWADREHGLVRIPVARAMEMIAARGAAAYEPLEPARWPDPRR